MIFSIRTKININVFDLVLSCHVVIFLYYRVEKNVIGRILNHNILKRYE